MSFDIRPETTLIAVPSETWPQYYEDGTGRFAVHRTGTGVWILDDNEDDRMLRVNCDTLDGAQYALDMIVNAERAAYYEAQSRGADRRKDESWDRSDTDGFLTQWAAGCMSALYRLQAKIELQGGMWEVPALFDLDGNLVAARNVKGRYGYVWAVMASDEPYSEVIAWVNESKARTPEARAKALAKKGYAIGSVWVPVKAELGGGTTPHPYCKRMGPAFSRNVKIGSTSGFDTYES